MLEEKVIDQKKSFSTIYKSSIDFFDEKEKEIILNLFNFKEVYVNIPLKISDKEIKNIVGIKIDNLLYYKDTFCNIRIHPFFDLEYFRELSIQNSLISSLFEIPVNGSYASILVDPFKLSVEEKEELFKMFFSLLKNEIFSNVNFFSSDLNSNINDLKILSNYLNFYSNVSRNIFSFLDLYSDLKKEVDIEKINELSSLYSIIKYYELKKKSLEDISVVLIGFGDKPYFLSKKLEKEGANIVGILTHLGSFYDPYGIELEVFYKDYLSGFLNKEERRYKKIDPYTFEKIRSDISIFYVDLFRDKFLRNLNTSLVMEGKKMVLDKYELKILQDRKVEVLPSSLTCSGEIILYDEIRKNRIPKNIEKIIQDRVYKKMEEIFETSLEGLKTKIERKSLRNLVENFL